MPLIQFGLYVLFDFCITCTNVAILFVKSHTDFQIKIILNNYSQIWEPSDRKVIFVDK